MAFWREREKKKYLSCFLGYSNCSHFISYVRNLPQRVRFEFWLVKWRWNRRTDYGFCSLNCKKKNLPDSKQGRMEDVFQAIALICCWRLLFILKKNRLHSLRMTLLNATNMRIVIHLSSSSSYLTLTLALALALLVWDWASHRLSTI